jgi:hypothetical protein
MYLWTRAISCLTLLSCRLSSPSSAHNSDGLETIFGLKMLKFFDADADPESGSGNLFYRGYGMEKIPIQDPGYTSRIRNTGIQG